MVNWFVTRFSWPRVLFLSNLNKGYFVATETMKFKTPCISIIDTDSRHAAVTFPVPGNNESTESAGYFNNVMASFIALRKLFYLVSWYFFIRKSTRIKNFLLKD